MTGRLISAKEVLRKRFVEPEVIKNHLFECAQRIVIEEVERALNFELPCGFDVNMDHDSDLWCCFDIPTGKLEEIYDHKYFPHEDFNSWLAKYNWKLEDTHEEGKRYLSLVSINCLKEDFGLSEEDLNRLDYVGLSFT